MIPLLYLHPRPAAPTASAGPKAIQFFLTLLLLCGALHSLHADEPLFSPDHLFVEGATAYDSGNYPDAVAAWQAIVQGGVGAPSVFYNLGNAHFKSGDFPAAVLFYERARSFIPRDAELAANLDFSLQQLNAPRETYPFWHQTARKLSRKEWQRVGLAAHWLCCLSLFIPLLSTRFRRPGLRIAAGWGLLALLSLPPLIIWNQFEKASPVVLLDDTPARYAPLDNAAVHYEAPKGTLATLADESGDWLKIRSGGKEGWVLKARAQPVYPLDKIPSS
jgi:tetratricopeptide (TPR) repeat protein